MMIRLTLTLLVVFLGSALLLAVGLHVQDAWSNTEMAGRFARSDAVRAEFLGAAADLARERDWTYLSLHEAGPIGGEAARRLGELRGLADRGLDAALSGLAATGFVPLLSGSVLADVASTSKALRDNRAEVDGALARPRDARPPEAADRWYSTVSTLITATQNLRFDLLRALPPADKLLADHSSLKQFVWIASEQASRGRAILAGVIAERRRPTNNELATLASADAQIGLAWRTVQAIVGDEMAPEVTGAVAAAQRAYFGGLMRLREQVYKAAREASPYPVTAEQWFARASDAIDTMLRVEAESVRETAAHTTSLVARARRNYLVWAALGVLGLLAVTLCVMILEKRVLAPLRALTVTMASLAKGDLRAVVPRHPRRDELGAMAHALRRLKTAALQAQRLRAAKERAERQTLQAIRDREVGLRAIFDSVSEGIVTVAADGRVEAANPAAGALFGRQPEQLVGQSVLTLVPEPEAARYGTPVLHYLATGRSDLLGVPQEVAGLRVDGSPVQLEVTVAEARLADRSVLTASLRDITERRRVERMKSEFVSTVSHELRTPLTSIRGSLSLLLGLFGSELKGQARLMVEMAHRNAERLIALVNDILDIEKLESGRLEFAFRPLDLVALAREAVETNQSFAAEREVALRLASAPAGLRVSGDPGRLLQVMANLLSNAAKFSERGSEVTVGVERHGGTARVVVRDTGPGVPEAFRRRIFQRFAQADGADSRRQGGTGLGLSISKAIVERHGGRIGFDSRPGDTTFYFTLPVLVEASASEMLS